ncbi:hypothetical protein Ntsu_21170 [Nocardia sp. IFM 10818]
MVNGLDALSSNRAQPDSSTAPSVTPSTTFRAPLPIRLAATKLMAQTLRKTWRACADGVAERRPVLPYRRELDSGHAHLSPCVGRSGRIVLPA